MNTNDFMKLIIADMMKREVKIPEPSTNNVTRMVHFYRDNTTAVFDHFHNLIQTYGKEQVRAIIADLQKAGDL